MDDIRVGNWIRVARRRAGLRQSDLASLAGVSPQTVVRLEKGRAGGMTLQTCRSVAAALGIQLFFVPYSSKGADIDRQIDRRHAAMLELVISQLSVLGWECSTEYSFNHFGDRGSVDILAWHEASRTLLIIEIKSELRDVQDTLRALGVKLRVVPGRVATDCGRRAAHVGVLLVLPDLRSERDRVARHSATFATVLPRRTVDARRWLKAPNGEFGGISFLRLPAEELRKRRATTGDRVRRKQDPGLRMGA